MRASDFVTTSSERDDAALRLVQTEETDAVNSGLVGSADKSGSTLKGTSVVHKAAKGGVSNAALAAVTNGRMRKQHGKNIGEAASVDSRTAVEAADGAANTFDGRPAKSFLRGGAKAAASGVAAHAINSTLEGTELEGADDLYYKGKAVKGAVRYARKRFRKVTNVTGSTKTAGRRVLSLSGRNANVALKDKTHGPLSKKGAAKAKSTVADKSKAQMARYFKRNVYSSVIRTKATATTSSSVVQRLFRPSGSSIKGLLSTIGGVTLPVLGIIIVLVLFVSIIGGIGGSGAASESSSASLTAVENQVATYLMSQGLDELHTAAIMGNMYGESGMDPTSAESGGTGIGICQWSGTRASNLRTYAASQGKNWTDLSVQLDFFWNQDIWQSEWSSSYTITVHQVDGDPEVGEVVSGSKSSFLDSTDLTEATKLFCYGWERPGVPRINIRLEAAQRYYTALISGGTGGQDYANAEQWQKDIVDAAYSTPSTGSGYCAAWVTNVYRNAGLTAPTGNACCMYLNYCTSSDTSELEVGMIVAYQQSTSSHGIWNNGHLGYGHVGIYIGDGMVISNRGSIVTETLEEFSASAYTGCEVKWGWPPGVS